MITRRTFLRDSFFASSALTIFPLVACGAEQSNQTLTIETPKMTAKMEDALELLSRFGPEYRGGLANHAPMVADALISMGRSDEVLPWVESYSRSLDERPKPFKRISAGDWKEALSDFNRYADWVEFFRIELKEQSWQDALKKWAPQLAPGLSAAAAHGLLRTAHIARRLQENATPRGVNELAEGLAYWASRYQTLNTSDAVSLEKKMKPAEAIQKIQLLPEDQRRDGFITHRLEKLNDLASFGPVIHWIDTSIPASELLSDLTATFAHLYLMSSRRSLIAFVHAVTGPSSIRILLPYLSKETVVPVLQYGWQLAAGIYASHAVHGAEESKEEPDLVPENLVDRAVAAGDEHAIKFTEACLREYRIKRDPVYLAASSHACNHLSR